MTVWRLEWREALQRRRLLAWNVAVPVLLLAPVAIAPAAAPHRVAVFGVFFVFFGTFGAAIPLVRDARDGWIDEVLRTGYGARRWFVERVLAGAAIDTVQLVPALGTLLVATGAFRASPAALAGLAAALLFANVLGSLLAALVRSLAEAALASAAASLLLLHLAGFFRPPAGGWSSLAAAWNPYAPLRATLGTALDGGVAPGAAWPAPLLTLSLVTGLATLVAGAWTLRFRWPRGEG